MANSLNRQLAVDEIVVLTSGVWCGSGSTIDDRAVRVKGGFGMFAETSGAAMWVEFLSDGEKTHASGYDIDPEDTAAYHSRRAAPVQP